MAFVNALSTQIQCRLVSHSERGPCLCSIFETPQAPVHASFLIFMVYTQWCTIMRASLKFARESHADGEGNLARWRNKSAALFTHFLTQKCTPLSRVEPEGCDEEEEEPAEFGQEEGAEDEARDVARARGHLLLRRLLLLVAIVGGTLIQ